MDVRKSIVKSIWLTLLTMIILTITAGVVFVFVFTKQCADFMYDIGCNNIASILYYKAYEDDGDIDNCYKALNIKITLKEYADIVEYYEKLVADEKFEEYMSSNIENREKLDISVLEKSAILNDMNYLVNGYVKALSFTNQIDKAKTVALTEFALKNNFTFKVQGVYAFGQFVDSENWEFFTTQHSDFDSPLIDEMQEYFDALIVLFDDAKAIEGNTNRAYLVALGNRLIDVGQDINAVYTATNPESEEISTNVSKMLIVNNVIKGII